MPTSSSARIIPLDSTPRSFALPSFVPSGMSAPGRATATIWPAATFGAPQTIVLRLAGADVDLAHGQPVGVRMRLRLEHAADDEPVGLAHADALDPRDLGAGEVEPLGDLGRREIGRAVLAQPRDRDPHPNCSRNGRSLSKKRRRSGTPCFSIAIRSMPIPNAKPW